MSAPLTPGLSPSCRRPTTPETGRRGRGPYRGVVVPDPHPEEDPGLLASRVDSGLTTKVPRGDGSVGVRGLELTVGP